MAKVLAEVTGSISFSLRGDKGQKGALMREHDGFESGSYKYLSGAGEEAYVDVVCVKGKWYQCTKTYDDATSSPSLTDGHWTVMSNYKSIATHLLLAENATINMLGSNQINLYNPSGGAMFGSFRVVSKDNDYALWLGAPNGANAPFSVTKGGKLKVSEAIVQGRIEGSLRNPFAKWDAGMTINIGGFVGTDYSDNLVSYFTDKPDGWDIIWVLPWDISQNGRRITIINYKWNDTECTAPVEIHADNGKYFFVDGYKKTSLIIPKRSMFVLMGYGDDKKFYGWIVEKYISLDSVMAYGSDRHIIAAGRTKYSNSGVSFETLNVFNGNTSDVSVIRLSPGRYNLRVPSSWFYNNTEYVGINVTGYGNAYNESSPIKANVYNISYVTPYINIYIDTSDDATRNDGGFIFELYNTNDIF